MVVVWIVVLVVTLLLEAATFALVALWFSFGALAAAIAAICGAEVWLQAVIFTAVSIVMLIFTRPIVKKLMPNKFIPTNSELNVGKSATVIEEINNERGGGRVRLNGVDWIAVSENDEIIPNNSVVIVKEVRGAKLIVCKKD